MTRPLFAVSAILLAASSSRAADPQPVWEIDTATETTRSVTVNSVGFSADGKKLIARFEHFGPPRQENEEVRPIERVLVWDAGSRRKQLAVDLGECLTSVHAARYAVTPTGSLLVPGSKCREIRLSDGSEKPVSLERVSTGVWFDAASGKAVWLLDEFVSGLAISGGTLPPFEFNRFKPMREKWTVARLKSANDIGGGYRAVAASTDLMRLAVANRDTLILYIIELGDTLKLKEVAYVPSSHRGPIRVIQFSPDGKTLATASEDSTVFLWDIPKAGKGWKPYATILGGNFMMAALAFSPDGRTLAAGTLDQRGPANLYMIDVREGKLISSRRLKGAVTAIAYSPDGQTLITGEFPGKIRAWDAAAVRGD